MVREPGFHGCRLVGREGEDVREAAAGEDDCFAGLFGLRDGSVGDDLRGANGGDVGACGGKTRVEDPRGTVVVLLCCGVDALAAVAGDTAVAGGEEEGGAGEAELHVFHALAAFVGGGEVGFVVAVGGGDDFCGGEPPAVFRALVGSWAGVGVGVGGVLEGVVAGAVGSVQGVEEIVE